jgi:SnoaL-like domain
MAMRKLMLVWIAVTVGCEFAAASPQKDVVAQFYELREKTLDQRGTKLEVDKLLSLLTDDVTYQHPMASVVMTKAQARHGMLAHLREGENARYTLRRARFVDNFAVVELILEYTVAGKKISRAGIAVFEFSGDKISRVTEY